MEEDIDGILIPFTLSIVVLNFRLTNFPKFDKSNAFASIPHNKLCVNAEYCPGASSSNAGIGSDVDVIINQFLPVVIHLHIFPFYLMHIPNVYHMY